MLNLSPILILIFAFNFFSFHSQAETPTSSTLNELQSIDQEIADLEKELENTRKKIFNKELQAQPYMFDNWHEFAQDIDITEEGEKHISAIKKKIQELEERKESLLKQSSSKGQ